MAFTRTTGIMCGLAAATFGVGYLAYKCRNVRFVTEKAEIDAEEVMLTVECGEDVLKQDPDFEKVCHHRTNRTRRITTTARAVLAAKAQFGMIDAPSSADRMMVSKWIRDWLKKKGVHAYDACRIAPIAAELFWAPTRAEIYAKQIAKSAAVGVRTVAHGRTFWSRSGWFGTPRSVD